MQFERVTYQIRGILAGVKEMKPYLYETDHVEANKQFPPTSFFVKVLHLIRKRDERNLSREIKAMHRNPDLIYNLMSDN